MSKDSVSDITEEDINGLITKFDSAINSDIINERGNFSLKQEDIYTFYISLFRALNKIQLQPNIVTDFSDPFKSTDDFYRYLSGIEGDLENDQLAVLQISFLGVRRLSINP